MIEKTKEMFCKHCKGTSVNINDIELVDGDDQFIINKEWCTCNDCGKEFCRITEWKLTGFTFYRDEAPFTLEDTDYEIEEE